MNTTSRKEFLQASALLLGSMIVGSSFDFRKQPVLLSFSTLGCPDWTFEQITEFADKHGFSGIEIRGLQRQMDLTQCPEFTTSTSRKDTLSLMKKKRLQFVGLGSSANMHARGAEREKNIAEAKRFIDLAAQIHCPYIRVFPNNLPKDEEKKKVMERISKNLLELGDYASTKNVMVLMETHGDLTSSDDILEVMHEASHPHVGLVWDVCNMWTIYKEPPALVYNKLRKYIHHTHIKDARLVDGQPHYTLLGQGDVPIFEAIDALAKGGYKGYYSFEWEKLWHPEIAEPEIAIADYPVAMKRHFGG
jgi:sugar phosphate isomerase/epimerase